MFGFTYFIDEEGQIVKTSAITNSSERMEEWEKLGRKVKYFLDKEIYPQLYDYDIED